MKNVPIKYMFLTELSGLMNKKAMEETNED